MKNDKNSVGLAGALWLNRADNKFLGGDRIELLEKIDELGSITKAAKAAGISYKTAWDTINMINNLAEKPLVNRLTGGKGGGGTSLTAEGKKVINQFKTIQEEHRKFLKNLENRLGDTDSLYQFLRRISMKVSARNTFAGTVTNITKGAVNAEVTLTLKGGIPLTAVVTNGAIDNLGLEPVTRLTPSSRPVRSLSAPICTMPRSAPATFFAALSQKSSKARSIPRWMWRSAAATPSALSLPMTARNGWN